MNELIKAHGNLNDVLLIPSPPEIRFASVDERAEFVRGACDRNGLLGADGVYFLDMAADVPEAEYFNSDGTPSEYCGNGMRCVGRWVMDQLGSDEALVKSGEYSFEVSRVPEVDPGVQRVKVRALAPVRYMSEAVDGLALRGAVIPDYDPSLRLSAISAPNPHLVAIVDEFDDDRLRFVGGLANTDRTRFPEGINTSFIIPMRDAADSYFVRTYERGVGITPSCASGSIASAVHLVAEGFVAEKSVVSIHNAGGTIDIVVRERDGEYLVDQTGNASFVYRTTVEADDVLSWRPRRDFKGIAEIGEIKAWDAVAEKFRLTLAEAGISAEV